MRLIGKDKIAAFQEKHATSRKSLDRFVKLIEGNSFAHFAALKLMFRQNVDQTGAKTVFDVGGNKIRTITVIEYGTQVVIVTHVMTHDEYSKGGWK